MNKETKFQNLITPYRDSLNAISDLYGDGCSGMSDLFYLLNHRVLHWLDNDPTVAVREKEIRFRKRFYPVLQKIDPGVLACTQVIENRKQLENPTCAEPDEPIRLPDRPVIFAANHGFHDDVLATVLTAGRPCYYVWGSLPLLYNTFDGFATSLVGCVCVNRKNAASRKALVAKAVKAIEYGMSIIIFPEGGWNKTSERLMLDLWKGVYDISAAAKCDVVPIAHYVRDMEVLDKKNLIHTVMDDPIRLYAYERDEGLTILRDTLASWQYKMMEAYGRSDRMTEMQGFDTSDDRWHAHLKERMKGVARYDSTIERYADYRPKNVIRPEDAFLPIAQISDDAMTAQNMQAVLAARKLVQERTDSDFQRLY